MVKRKQMDDEGVTAPSIVDVIAKASSKENTSTNNNAVAMAATVGEEGPVVAMTIASPKEHPPKLVSVTPSDESTLPILPVALSGTSTSESSFLWEDVETLRRIASYVGNHHYRYVASINQSFQTAYKEEFPASNDTYRTASTVAYAKICFEEMEVNPLNQEKLACSAVKHGCLPALEYLKSVKCEFDVGPTTVAAHMGQLPILQWLLHNGYCVNSRICETAAKNGHLHVLQWLREKKTSVGRFHLCYGSIRRSSCVTTMGKV